MNNNQTYPYSDDKMFFDQEIQQYVLTEQALISRGIDLRSELAATEAVTPEGVIDTFCRLASDMIYGYIHSFGADNMCQDRMIACLPSLRPVIYNAMLYQVVYLYAVGNLTLSTVQSEREKAIDETAKSWLNRTVPELGRSILYVGVY